MLLCLHSRAEWAPAPQHSPGTAGQHPAGCWAAPWARGHHMWGPPVTLSGSSWSRWHCHPRSPRAHTTHQPSLHGQPDDGRDLRQAGARGRWVAASGWGVGGWQMSPWSGDNQCPFHPCSWWDGGCDGQWAGAGGRRVPGGAVPGSQPRKHLRDLSTSPLHGCEMGQEPARLLQPALPWPGGAGTLHEELGICLWGNRSPQKVAASWGSWSISTTFFGFPQSRCLSAKPAVVATCPGDFGGDGFWGSLLLSPGDSAGGSMEWAVPALCHPVVHAPGELPTPGCPRADPWEAAAGHPGRAGAAGDPWPLQGTGRWPHGICLHEGRGALQARWGHPQHPPRALPVPLPSLSPPCPCRDPWPEGPWAGGEPAGPVTGDAGPAQPFTLPWATRQVPLSPRPHGWHQGGTSTHGHRSIPQVWEAAAAPASAALHLLGARGAALLPPHHRQHPHGEAAVWHVQELNPPSRCHLACLSPCAGTLSPSPWVSSSWGVKVPMAPSLGQCPGLWNAAGSWDQLPWGQKGDVPRWVPSAPAAPHWWCPKCCRNPGKGTARTCCHPGVTSLRDTNANLGCDISQRWQGPRVGSALEWHQPGGDTGQRWCHLGVPPDWDILRLIPDQADTGQGWPQPGVTCGDRPLSLCSGVSHLCPPFYTRNKESFAARVPCQWLGSPWVGDWGGTAQC